MKKLVSSCLRKMYTHVNQKPEQNLVIVYKNIVQLLFQNSGMVHLQSHNREVKISWFMRTGMGNIILFSHFHQCLYAYW